MQDSRPLRTTLSALVLLALIMIVTGFLGGADFAPDVAAIRELQEWRTRSPRLTGAMIVLTHLGSVWATIGAGMLAAFWIGVRGEVRRSIILLTATLGERLMLDGLKLLLDRARPSFDAYPVLTHSSSFPSGHAANTMAVFLAIALIAAPERWRRQAVALAVLLSMAIGVTRPYLGVHWPTDVVGGWALGAAIAILAAHWVGRARSFAPAQQQH